MKTIRTLLVLLLLAPSLTSWAGGIGKVRMGVVLPLKESTHRGAKMVEFYQGILMAVDSLRHEGLSIEVQAVHSGSTAAQMDSLLAVTRLSDCDVIFGPLDAAQVPALADYCDLHKVRLVVPFSTSSIQLIGHPHYYQVTQLQTEVQAEAVSILTNTYGKSNYIFVDTADDNITGKNLVKLFKDQLTNLEATSHNLPLTADSTAYEKVMSMTTSNVVVLNSSSIRSLNLLLPHLESFQRQHPFCEITLFGYPDWQTYTSQRLADFYKYNTYIYTSFFRNPLEQRTGAFERQFMHWFGRPMFQTFPRYGMMGFDLAYYFLRGLQIYGEELEQHHVDVPFYPFQHPLRFEHESQKNGYVNRHVELIHYTPKQTIEILFMKP